MAQPAVLRANTEPTISSGDNWVKLVSTSPATPATLKSGQIITVNFEYAAKDPNYVYFEAFPYYRGQNVGYLPGRSIFQSSINGNGTGLAFFSCPGGKNVDQIKVTMQQTGSGKVLAQSFAPI